jgi:HlyD family secretion protein
MSHVTSRYDTIDYVKEALRLINHINDLKNISRSMHVMKKKRKFSWWIIPLVVVVALVGTVFYLRAHPIQVTTPTIDIASLTTTRITTGSISTGIGATGTVQANQSASLAWAASGQVAKVLVKKGDQVQANQILAQIDPNSSPNLVSALANLATAQETLANLQNVTVNQANAQVSLINAQNAVTTATNTLNGLALVPTQAQISAAYAAYLTDQQTVSKLQTTFDNLASRPIDDLERAQALAALDAAIQKENTDLADYNYLLNYIPDADSVAKAKANLALVNAQLVVAQSNWDAVKNGPDQVQVASAQANINAIQATLDQQYIRAPFAGTITVVTVKQGDLTSNGTSAFQLTDMSALYVYLQVSEVDINTVKIGQTVNVTYDAIANKQYTGTVSDISSVGTVSGGVANFTVTVQLKDADSAVMVGMTGSANIVTNSVTNVLVVPNRAIATLGTAKVVYVIANGAVTPVRVTIGLASATQTEITSTNLVLDNVIVTNPTALTSPTSTSNTSIFANLFRSLGITTGGGGGRFAGGGGFPAGGGGFPAGGGGFPAGGGGFPGGGTNGG